jgi:protoporphyrin/coproporphyrin ferrochelatase
MPVVRSLMTRFGILLVNLGTPDSPKPRDVYRYLQEFLLDPRVIDIPTFQRNLLVRGIIVPFRHRKSARTYQEVWTTKGSPLMVYGQRLRDKLQALMGEHVPVELAMRYQNPSILKGLEALRSKQVQHIIIVPLFPQYASATTGSVHDKVMEILRTWQSIPELSFISNYATHPAFLDAFAVQGQRYNWKEFDHVVFSFHGLPERQIFKGDDHGVCTLGDCCNSLGPANHLCYRAQCFATARGIAERLGIPESAYTVAFQSRLGKAEWIKPYSEPLIIDLAKQGMKRLLVFSPAFVADCLETIYEIGIEYQEVFEKHGGEKIQLVESLNDSDVWVKGLKQIIDERMNE